MTDLFHKILIHLHDNNSLGQDLDITDFLKNELGNDQYVSSELWKVAGILNRLITYKYIEHFHVPVLGRQGNQSETNNLDERKIVVKLELLGLNYIADKIAKIRQEELLFKQTEIAEKSGQSVIDANEFNVKTTQKNGKLFWLTFIIALLGAAGTIAGVILSYQQQKLQQGQLVQDSTLSLIKNKTIQIEHTLFLQQKTIDSLQNILNEKP